MQLILTHENADFDAVASLLAGHKLFPEAVPLLPRRINRNVDQFLMLYWGAFPFLRPADWQRRRIDEVLLVDTHALNTVRGMVRHPKVHVVDHHVDHKRHESWTYQVEPVGAATTMLVEKLQATGLKLSAEEATLLLLGVYEDTGALTYDTTCPRDILAAAWLVDQGAILAVVRRFLHIPLTPAQQALYDALHTAVSWHEIHGQTIVVTAAVAPDGFTDEIASIAHRLREALTPAGLILLVQLNDDVQLVGRSTTEQVDVAAIAQEFGGGGHDRAAAARIKDASVTEIKEEVVSVLPQAVKPLVRVSQLMSFGVQTVVSTLTVAEAAVLMQRYGYEGYPVIDAGNHQIVGLLTRRAVDRAMSHKLGHSPVHRFMKSGVVTVRPSDSIDHVQQLMLTEGWGQIPVLAEDAPVQNAYPIGIITRTDLLNYLFKSEAKTAVPDVGPPLLESLPPALWQMVLVTGKTAAALNLPLYFVGGIVRDLLLGKPPTDLDMVVEGDAIKLAKELQKTYGGDIHAHRRFGTAKWRISESAWQTILQSGDQAHSLPGDHSANALSSIDFVTARTEFYAEPSALPEVAYGSIKLDLHRRDFTINTLAIRLDGAFFGQLIDFYGGQRDIEQGVIRVLHSLSFVDDPTRILRAIRLEQRLGFLIESRTVELMADALPLLDRVSGSRIRHEIELTFREADPVPVMARLAELNVNSHIHPGLTWSPETAAAFARVPLLLADPEWAPAGESPVFLFFALWMMPLTSAVQTGVMARLRVRKATRVDVQACSQALLTVMNLPPDSRPSQVEKALRPYPPRVLLVAYIMLEGQPAAAFIEQYHREWRHVKTAVTGDDLRQSGLKPGPEYAVILDRLLAARLDGDVTDEAGEQSLLAQILAEGE